MLSKCTVLSTRYKISGQNSYFLRDKIVWSFFSCTWAQGKRTTDLRVSKPPNQSLRPKLLPYLCMFPIRCNHPEWRFTVIVDNKRGKPGLKSLVEQSWNSVWSYPHTCKITDVILPLTSVSEPFFQPSFQFLHSPCSSSSLRITTKNFLF